jgi:adenosylcobyric acid synthase
VFRWVGRRRGPLQGSEQLRAFDCGEIGVARWLQAGAVGVAPTVDMNLVLLAPESDTRGQIVCHGAARLDLTFSPGVVAVDSSGRR